MKKYIQPIQESIVKLDHLNIGLLILLAIAMIILVIIFIRNLSKILSGISGSVKDPKTGRWSGKLLSALAVTALIIFAHIIWLKHAFIAEDFALLPEILVIDYSYLALVYGLRTYEKRMDLKAKKDAPTDETTAEPVT